jgi:hypothetical protein
MKQRLDKEQAKRLDSLGIIIGTIREDSNGLLAYPTIGELEEYVVLNNSEDTNWQLDYILMGVHYGIDPFEYDEKIDFLVELVLKIKEQS